MAAPAGGGGKRCGRSPRTQGGRDEKLRPRAPRRAGRLAPPSVVADIEDAKVTKVTKEEEGGTSRHG